MRQHQSGHMSAHTHQLWGGRFASQPDAHMRVLNDSLPFDIQLWAVDIEGSRAYAQALQAAKLISAEENQAIQQGLAQIYQEFAEDKFQVASSDEDIHTAIERRLIELIGEAGGKLHTGRSRNDQVATDIRLWLRVATQHLSGLITDFQKCLLNVAEAHLHTIFPGYTHFQPAQPITVAHWLMSFFWMVERDKERLHDLGHRANVMPLGASALAGTPYPIDQTQLAESLGFAGIIPNSLDAVSDRDSVAEFLFTASLIALHLSKLAEDIILFANPALQFVRLPDAFSTGSSIMPQKRNADPMELARGKAGRLVGNLTGFLTTLKGLPSGYNKDLQEDKEPLFDSYDTLVKLLPVITGLMGALEFVPENMTRALESGLLATELADWLVLEKNLPFRSAHHLVGQIVKLAEAEGVALQELPLEAYQQVSPVFESGLYKVLNFESAVQKRRGIGGTSPAAVTRQIEQARAVLAIKT